MASQSATRNQELFNRWCTAGCRMYAGAAEGVRGPVPLRRLALPAWMS